MFRFTAFTAALACILALSQGYYYNRDYCYHYCAFKFCDGNDKLYLGQADKALTKAICKHDGTKIGYVDQTGEAIHYYSYYYWFYYTKISQWHPYGLKQKFTPSFFKAYAIPDKSVSGVGHETPQQNQVYYLKNQCFILPIVKWQTLNDEGNVIANPKGDYPYYQCIAFQAK